MGSSYFPASTHRELANDWNHSIAYTATCNGSTRFLLNYHAQLASRLPGVLLSILYHMITSKLVEPFRQQWFYKESRARAPGWVRGEGANLWAANSFAETAPCQHQATSQPTTWSHRMHDDLSCSPARVSLLGPEVPDNARTQLAFSPVTSVVGL